MPAPCQQTSTVDFAAFIAEAASPEWETFRHHVRECASCSTELQQWTRLEKTLRVAGQEIVAPHPPEELLVQFHNRPESCTAADRDSIVQHLQECPICGTTMSLMASFDFSRLQQWVDEAQFSPSSTEQEQREGGFSRLIVQLTDTGLRFLESHLVSPLIAIQELLTATAPAYRLTQKPAAVHLALSTGQARILVTIGHEGGRIALKMTFCDIHQTALAGHRVFLRRHGRSVFSAKTDAKGELHPPRLKPDTYEVACPGLQITFQLEFCP